VALGKEAFAGPAVLSALCQEFIAAVPLHPALGKGGDSGSAGNNKILLLDLHVLEIALVWYSLVDMHHISHYSPEL
jgi:hypothetical protein